MQGACTLQGVGAGSQRPVRFHILGPNHRDIQQQGQIFVGSVQGDFQIPISGGGQLLHMAQPVPVYRTAHGSLEAGNHILHHQGTAVGKGGVLQRKHIGFQIIGATVGFAQHRLRPVLRTHKEQALIQQG